MFKKTVKHESKTYGAGNELPISLHNMPEGQRVTHFTLKAEGTIAKSTATNGTATEREIIAACVDYVKLVTPFYEVDLKGTELYDLAFAMEGKPWEKKTVTVPGESSTTFRVKVVIPVVDPRHAFPLDCAQPSGFFEGKSLTVKCGASATVKTAITISATTLELESFYVPGNGGKVPAKVVLRGLDHTGTTPKIDDVNGALTHLCVVESDGALTEATYATAEVRLDGREVMPATDFDTFIGEWNRHVARSEADELDDESSVEFLPLLFPERGYNLTKVPAGKLATVKFTGTVSSCRLIMRIVQLTGTDEAVAGGKKLGLDVGEGTKVAAATGSKTPVSAAAPVARQAFLTALLPKRLGK